MLNAYFTSVTLLIDTGSSNTWVGATKPFEATSSTVNTGQIVVGAARLCVETLLDTRDILRKSSMVLVSCSVCAALLVGT